MIRLRLLVAASSLLTSAAIAQTPRFRTEQLADGVYLIAPTATQGFGSDANSLVVVGREGTLVVDAQFSASSTEEVIRIVRRISKTPVRWLINTHWHDDHVSGNAAWKRADPAIEIIAHRYLLEDMPRDGAANRASFLKAIPGTSAFLLQHEREGTGIDGKPTDSTELAAFAAYRDLMARFAAESLSTAPTLPTRTVDDSAVINLGGRNVVLRYLGPGHTRADLTVDVPDAGVIAVGDLVTFPVPLIGTTSYPREFGATLERLLRLNHRVLIPGHGPALTDDAHVRATIAMLSRIRSQVDSMRLAGDSLPAIRRQIHLDEDRRRFAGDDRLRNELFTNYVLQPAVAKAFEDGRRGSGSVPQR